MLNPINPNPDLFEADNDEMVMLQDRKTLQTNKADTFSYLDFECEHCTQFIQRLEEWIANREKTEYNFHGSLYILNQDGLGMQDRWEILRQWCNRGCQYDDEIVAMYKNFQSTAERDEKDSLLSSK